jgi:hypothetical protein
LPIETLPQAGASAGGARAAVERAAVQLAADDKPAQDTREKFIPVTRQALMERLTRPHAWPSGQADAARRFFRYLDYWRQQTYAARLLDLEQTYEAFSPDSDLLVTRKFTASERTDMRKRLVAQVTELLEQANFTRIDANRIELILTKDSHYGLDLHVDLSAFDELLIFHRGTVTRRENRRRFYVWKEEFDVRIFQRLCIVFKLRPTEDHIQEIMRSRGCSRKEAERTVRRFRRALPPQIKSDHVYLKLFKNMPRNDIEMVFPNTRVRFRLFDKIRLGVTAGGGFGMGVVGTASKIAVATNPIALAGAIMALGGIAFRQAMSFLNQRNRYMVTMAQNLYFHALADNRGVMTLLADRAAEEDIKEEMLLYSVLAKESVQERDLADIDAAIEQYLLNAFGVSANFDVQDALRRLIEDGIVAKASDGTLRTLPPTAAAAHIDEKWDRYLDELPDQTRNEGLEFDSETGEAVA